MGFSNKLFKELGGFSKEFLSVVDKYEDIIIYGYRDIGTCVLDYLINLETDIKTRNYSGRVKFFATTSELEYTPKKKGVPIKHIGDLTEYCDRALVIVATQERHHSTIASELDRFSFKNRYYIKEETYIGLKEIIRIYNRQMEIYDFVRKSIQYYIDRDEKNFVIYPYGKIGKFVQTVLNDEYSIKERYVVDKNLCNGDEIKSIEELKMDYLNNSDFKILIASDYSSQYSAQVHQQILSFAKTERIINLCSPSLYFNPWNYYEKFMSQRNKKHIVTECLSREIYRNGVIGEVAEAGVYKGDTAKHINYMFPDRKLYLFDTFTGFDEKDQKYDDEKGLFNLKLDYSNTSEQIVMDKMLFPQNCIIKKGWFPESAADVTDRFAFVRLDMDLYEPIYAGLEFFYPLLSNGGYIAVHDCRSKNFDGARAALMDFCKKNHLNYVNMHDELGTAVIAKGL